ncbi:hypothetical protein [Actinomadura parmotrematis]|uniref:DZANK-type domain-containing protein n=1 Tax=Actinomadura parmotrematis TaxID=2864039 RepID=A0ABS7G3F2_9ACTN|nr:hypothetical protein [Actinomadura parmotrematis]MBW8487248.1 hypothetical protein [Actinomadura parmotrematis]
MSALVLRFPAPEPTPRFWYRCRDCGHSRPLPWRAWPCRETTLAAVRCGSCASPRITAHDTATRATVRLPRPLVVPPVRYRCGDCGTTGLTSDCLTCPACLGAGFI